MTSLAGAEAPTTRVDHVYSHLREGIIRGQFPSGAPLRAGAIASSLGVSVIPVREAIRLLEAEGLVTIEPNRGAKVRDMSAEDQEDIYLTRLALEADALRRSVPHLTRSDFAAAEHALHQMTSAYERRDIAEAIDWHRKFHTGLYARCGSKRLPQLIDSLFSASDRYLWASSEAYRGDNSGPEHEPILTAARSGNADAAVEALRLHHEASMRRIRQTVAGGTQQPD